ncbi:MAG: 5'-methylthioadenosine phosphorylase, partial [Syntrophaceae bacterium]
MGLLGIISGTILLRDFEGEFNEDLFETPFGTARVLVGRKFACIARHGTDKTRPILPHLINHPANLSAFKQIGVGEIIAVNSTGSLKKGLEPGMLAVPGDFMSFSATPTICREG